MSSFKKVGAKGKVLAAAAKKWDAVLDTTSGLTWSVAEKKVANWAEAKAYVEKLKTAGIKGWRLPTVEELFLLADRGRYNPAIDTDFFPACKSDWYWSSTPAAYSPAGCAWGVGFFHGGGAVWGARDASGFVRAVRSSQS